MTEEKRSRLLAVVRILWGILICGAGIWVCFWCGDFEESKNLMYVGLAVSVLLGILAWIPKTFPRFVSWIVLVGAPIASFYLLEWLTHDPAMIVWQVQILEYIFYWLFFTLCIFICGRMSIGYAIGEYLILFVGLANYFVMDFRSNPILPWDLTSAEVAFSVADNFVFAGSYLLMGIILSFLFLMVLAGKSYVGKLSVKPRVIGALICVALGFCYTSAIQSDEVIERCDIYEMPFTQWYTYKKNGFFVSFLVNAKYLKVETPEGYSTDKVEALIEDAKESYAESSAAESGEAGSQADPGAAGGEAVVPEDAPNIIVIMDEAFSDLTSIKEFTTSRAVMPFLDYIKGADNTTSGQLYVSVLGGNTANTEFEFLTGCSMNFLPAGSIPYQQFVKSEMPSLASILSSYGYQTLAMHPYGATGWNRNQGYPFFGFDRSMFKPDFEYRSILRTYITDEAMFNQICKAYLEKEEGKPIFIFGVTMQNHGSYTKDYDNFLPHISLVDPDLGNVARVNKYLSLCNLTDQALNKLINYFSTQDEKTIIVFFGDHQPALMESKFWKYLFGKNVADLTWQEQVIRYQVPFIIWANYDFEEEKDVQTSANYLALRVMEAAGLPLTDYQKYLLTVEEQYPIVTAGFQYDTAGTLYEGEHRDEILSEYANVQYNYLFDTRHRLDVYLPEAVD